MQVRRDHGITTKYPRQHFVRVILMRTLLSGTVLMWVLLLGSFVLGVDELPYVL